MNLVDYSGESSANIIGGVTGACFIEGTLVFTATGNVPIEKVEVGDNVYSENVITGEIY